MSLISSKSVNGIDEVIYDDRPTARNRYKLNGVVVPGVTTVIKAGSPTAEPLIMWKIGKGAEYAINEISSSLEDGSYAELDKELLLKESKLAWKKETEEAAGIGVIVHDYAQMLSLGKKDEGLEMLSKHEKSEHWNAILNACYKVDDFNAANKDTVLFTEQIVGSTKYGFAGRFDRLVRRGELVIMSDYKTSKSFYVEQFVQDALYSMAVEEWLGIKIDAFEVVRFGKDGGDFKPLLISQPNEIKDLKEQALGCLDTYKFSKRWSKDERFAYK